MAVELDDKLCEVLRMRMKEQDIGNVKIVNENILRFSIGDFRFQIFDFRYPVFDFLP